MLIERTPVAYPSARPCSLPAHPRRSAARIGWLLLATIGLAGCTVGPDYRTPSLPVRPAFAHQADLTAIASTGIAPPLETWWTGFHDPELARIVRRVLARNLDLRAAMARIEEARAAAREAGADEWPQGALQASVARQRQSLESPLGRIASGFPGYERDQTDKTLDAGASWELDLFGGQRRNAQAAQAEAQAAAARGAGVRVSLAAEAADAYLRVRAAQARIHWAEARVRTDRALVELVRRRLADGVATHADLARRQATLARTTARIPAMRTELHAQMDRLDVLMGAAPGTYDREVLSAPGGYVIPAIDASQGPAQLLRRRPDVIAAERRLAASSARIGVSMAEYYPKVTLSALLGFEALGAGTAFDSSAFQPGALAGLRWRLFDFGRVDAEVARARGANAEALAAYRQSMLLATEDVENAILAYAGLSEQYVQTHREVDADDAARRTAMQRYEAGATGFMQVLAADRELFAARERLAQAHANRARAVVAAFRALGGGWTPSGSACIGRLPGTWRGLCHAAGSAAS